jgi:hypothetical protein
MACALKCSVRFLAIVSVATFVVATLFLGDALLLGEAVRKDIHVVPSIRALGDLRPATRVPVVFRAINGSSRPIRVLGVQEICSLWGCVRAENLPCTIPPHTSSDVRLSLETTDGSHIEALVFDATVVLYSDCTGNNIIPLHLGGRVVPAGAEN